MRVDLELAWQRGEPRRMDDYLTLLPQLLDDAEVRADVAFEEYRTRVEHGEDVDAAEYETKYNVDTTGWTRLAAAPAAPSDPDLDQQFDTATSRYVPASPGQLPGPGDEWGDFEILDELGRGSLACTYLAKQRSLADRLVAVKFSSITTAESDKLARLQHPNIVPVYSIHQDQRWSVTCMPFRGRTTLNEVVSRPQLLDEVDQQYGSATREESVLRLVLGLADGLAHAHARGILHRDVKPANVLLTDDGEPMLLDFNLAVHRHELQTIAGGTVPYMAPEQLRSLAGQGAVDERSDIYSLGVVLVQLLTGQLPWRVSQADVDGQLPAILAERAQVDFAVLNTCTPAVTQIARKCLAASAADRYQSAADLVEDIRRHLADRPLKHARNRSLSELARKWARRHPRLCSLTSAAVLLVAGAIALAGAWTVREQQLAGARATQQLMTVTQELDALRPVASSSALFPERRETLRGAMDQLAERAGLLVADTARPGIADAAICVPGRRRRLARSLRRNCLLARSCRAARGQKSAGSRAASGTSSCGLALEPAVPRH